MFCPNCGTTNPDGANFCISCQHALNANPEDAITEVVYGGFLDRLAALFIDVFILGALNTFTLILAAVLIPLFSGKGNSGAGLAILLVVIYLLPLLISAVYFSVMESGERGATLGKRLLKLRVVDADGNRIGKGRALGRWFAHALSNISLLIGYLIQPFTAHKQALHDLVSGTVVIKSDKNANTTVIAIVIIAVALFFAVFIVGILAAIAIPSFMDYRTKAVVMQGASYAAPLETGIAMYYQENGKYPLTLADAGLAANQLPHTVAEYELVPGTGEFRITFNNNQPRDLAGKSILYSPMSPAGTSGMTGPWHCTSEDIRPALLPRDCR